MAAFKKKQSDRRHQLASPDISHWRGITEANNTWLKSVLGAVATWYSKDLATLGGLAALAFIGDRIIEADDLSERSLFGVLVIAALVFATILLVAQKGKNNDAKNRQEVEEHSPEPGATHRGSEESGGSAR